MISMKIALKPVTDQRAHVHWHTRIWVDRYRTELLKAIKTPKLQLGWYDKIRCSKNDSTCPLGSSVQCNYCFVGPRACKVSTLTQDVNFVHTMKCFARKRGCVFF